MQPRRLRGRGARSRHGPLHERVVSEALGAIREALKLADDVKRTGETLKELSRELREHDRRITRLEAQ